MQPVEYSVRMSHALREWQNVWRKRSGGPQNNWIEAAILPPLFSSENVRRGLALRQQNPQHIRSSLCSFFADSGFVEASQRVGEDNVRVVRDSAEFRHRVCARYERLCADYCGGNVAALEGDSVVHTARRARPSIARRGDHHVALLRELVQYLLGTRS